MMIKLALMLMTNILTTCITHDNKHFIVVPGIAIAVLSETIHSIVDSDAYFQCANGKSGATECGLSLSYHKSFTKLNENEIINIMDMHKNAAFK